MGPDVDEGSSPANQCGHIQVVAVLKHIAYFVLACCVLAAAGCQANEANAPVANPPGRTADPTKDIGHGPGKKLVPIPGMKLNPNAKPDVAPGSKAPAGGTGN
jgi:hypothetical protein